MFAIGVTTRRTWPKAGVGWGEGHPQPGRQDRRVAGRLSGRGAKIWRTWRGQLQSGIMERRAQVQSSTMERQAWVQSGIDGFSPGSMDSVRDQ